MNSRCRILIVDDDETNREIILEILAEVDTYRCATATKGEEALAIINRFRPDIVLLGVMMSGMNGYAVAKQIRDSSRHKYIKIIMISSRTTTLERLLGYDSGADDYLIKPFHGFELLAKIKVFAKLKLTEEVEEIKSSVASISAHETRTPLNAIYMSCQLLLDDGTLTAFQRNAVDNIYHSAQRLKRHVDKVLRLCQLKRGVGLEVSPLSVQEFLAFEVTTLQREFRGEVIVHCPEPGAELCVDGHLFREAFRGILENAAKFSPENGAITIASRVDKGMTMISLADQGPGIAPDHLDSIFDGYSVGNCLHHHEGSGLSLAISRTIIEQHGGELTCASTPGCGATFTIAIPRQA